MPRSGTRTTSLAKGYRQLVDQSYINPQDNRMTPNTFEGVTVGGKVDWVQYLAGYLWKIKPRNSDEFISMAEQAGAGSSDDGVILGGVRLTPMKDLRIDVDRAVRRQHVQHALLWRATISWPLNQDWKLRFGAQFTDQRAVGDELVANADEEELEHPERGRAGPGALQGAGPDDGFSITASGNTIQSPWGSFPATSR